MLSDQRAFLAGIRAQDPRITVHIGRLEARTEEDKAASELLRYLAGLKIRIPIEVYKDLLGIAKSHSRVRVFVEKAIDVQIAVDMVMMAANGDYETAYLLSADGDYTPAVEAVRRLGRKVFAVSPSPCVNLAAAADAYIRPKRDWFVSCMR